MAINGLDQTSMEQLMAMALMSNGQLTNDSTSSSASSETSYAFQLLMQSYLEKANSSTSESAQNAVNASGTSSETQTGTDSGSSSDAMSDLVNLSSTKQVQQNYSAGQNLLDIPLVTNESSNTSSAVNNVSSSSSLNSLLNSSDSDTMSRIYAAVQDASEKYGVSANLILAVIKQESDFNPTDVSSAGAQGLMQLMPCNVSSLGISDPYNIEQNIDGGTRLLKEGLDRYNGDLTMTLMAYNAGSGTMQSRGVTSASDLYKMPAETRNYVPKVLGYYNNGI